MTGITNFRIILIFISLLASSLVLPQSIVEEISDPKVTSLENVERVTEESVAQITKEKIISIGQSKKILIITNEASSLAKGDFFTLLVNDTERIARALVAKNHEGVAGIKIVKIYSLKRWNRLKRDSEVQILKGDDSFLGVSKRGDQETPVDGDNKAVPSISSEDDLYNAETMINDDGALTDLKDKTIQTDNVLSAAWGKYAVTDLSGGTLSFSHWCISWAYQFAQNFWGEGFYGVSYMPDYPYGGIDTQLNNIVIRLKYSVKGPFDIVFMPYLGYQFVTADSPGAGNGSQATSEEEIALVEDLAMQRPVVGLTILKRLVPGWFIKADLGSDIVNAGLALEF